MIRKLVALACLPRARPLLPSATLGNYICRSLKTYNFQTWQFYNFKVLFSVVSTDFLSKLEKTQLEGFIRQVNFEYRCRYQGKKLPCSQETKRRNWTNLTNRALSWNGIVKWPKYISKVHVKIGAERYATAGEICHSVRETRDTRRILFYVKKIMTNSSLFFACLGTWWFCMCACIFLSLFCPYIR